MNFLNFEDIYNFKVGRKKTDLKALLCPQIGTD